jgi:hypothetical protein
LISLTITSRLNKHLTSTKIGLNKPHIIEFLVVTFRCAVDLYGMKQRLIH